MKTLFLFCLLTGLLGLTTRGYAQFPTAKAGRYGVFVQMDNLLHGPRYVLERLETNTRSANTGWQPVYTTDEPPRSADVLLSRLTLLTRKNPLYELPTDSLTRLLFDRYVNAATADSLEAYRWNPQYLEAFGLGYLDTAVVQGRRYDYRIRPLNAGGDGASRSPVTVTVPGSKPAVQSHSLRHEATGSVVKITYHLKRHTPDLAGVKVLRATYAQTDFADCGANWGFVRGKKDSVFLIVTDDNVRRKMLYQYVVIPIDILGNEGQPSDTLTVANLRHTDALPTILSVKAQSVEASQAIRLSWQLSSTKDLRSVEIWRANRFDGPYVRYGSAAPTDTVFMDTRVEPIEGYYYQLRPNGTCDQLSASVRVPGMLKASRPAVVAPSFLRVSEVRDTLRFTWQRADFDTRGYYLYNSTDPQTPMQPYSGLIESRDSVITYAVPMRDLALSTGYRWAVAALNTSYNQGPLSNEVHSAMRLPERVPTPLNPVVLRQEKGILVVWDNMKDIDTYITGYAVYRQEEKGNETEVYRQRSDEPARNAYADTTVQAGKRYTYRVKAFRFDQKESAFSTTATFFQPLPPVLPLRGVKVLTSSQGVRVAWDEPIDQTLDKIVVYRYTDKTERPRLIGTLPGRQTEYLDRDATPGIAYYYTLVAVQTDKRESEPTDPIGVEWR
ncbi:hypothetical protein ACFSUS_15365 [Spirosoma soli]|uniref:Fibronectin type-III domain-containing protein n=1 Tax=Spirosoma soli TaxID=1770529 RepID=A0ABW5M4W4_9BACT